jgi:two-component system, cell cycle response regulator DivK
MTKTVLIVEDNELNMKLFHDLLEAHGIGTIETRNGLEVMAIAREKNPDLILMDIQLPEVSGLDVIKWLKNDEGLKHIPVIAVTAFAMKGDEEKIREGGCEDYISKPISVSRFIDVIKTYLDKPVLSAEAEEPQAETKFQIIDRAGDLDETDLPLADEDQDLDDPITGAITHQDTDKKGTL